MGCNMSSSGSNSTTSWNNTWSLSACLEVLTDEPELEDGLGCCVTKKNGKHVKTKRKYIFYVFMGWSCFWLLAFFVPGVVVLERGSSSAQIDAEAASKMGPAYCTVTRREVKEVVTSCSEDGEACSYQYRPVIFANVSDAITGTSVGNMKVRARVSYGGHGYDMKSKAKAFHQEWGVIGKTYECYYFKEGCNTSGPPKGCNNAYYKKGIREVSRRQIGVGAALLATALPIILMVFCCCVGVIPVTNPYDPSEYESPEAYRQKMERSRRWARVGAAALVILASPLLMVAYVTGNMQGYTEAIEGDGKIHAAVEQKPIRKRSIAASGFFWLFGIACGAARLDDNGDWAKLFGVFLVFAFIYLLEAFTSRTFSYLSNTVNLEQLIRYGDDMLAARIHVTTEIECFHIRTKTSKDQDGNKTTTTTKHTTFTGSFPFAVNTQDCSNFSRADFEDESFDGGFDLIAVDSTQTITWGNSASLEAYKAFEKHHVDANRHRDENIAWTIKKVFISPGRLPRSFQMLCTRDRPPPQLTPWAFLVATLVGLTLPYRVYFEKHTAAVPLLINKSITVPTVVKSLAFTVPENHEGSVTVIDPTTGKQHPAHVPGHASPGDVFYLHVPDLGASISRTDTCETLEFMFGPGLLGVTLVHNPNDLSRTLIVTGVSSGQASEAGVSVGDLIVVVDGIQLKDEKGNMAARFQRLLKMHDHSAGEPLRVTIHRPIVAAAPSPPSPAPPPTPLGDGDGETTKNAGGRKGLAVASLQQVNASRSRASSASQVPQEDEDRVVAAVVQFMEPDMTVNWGIVATHLRVKAGMLCTPAKAKRIYKGYCKKVGNPGLAAACEDDDESSLTNFDPNFSEENKPAAPATEPSAAPHDFSGFSLWELKATGVIKKDVKVGESVPVMTKNRVKIARVMLEGRMRNNFKVTYDTDEGDTRTTWVKLVDIWPRMPHHKVQMPENGVAAAVVHTAEESDQDAFPTGSRVLLHNLKTEKYNGRKGVVITGRNGHGRYGVRLDPLRSAVGSGAAPGFGFGNDKKSDEEALSLRPENIAACDRASLSSSSPVTSADIELQTHGQTADI